MRDKTDHAITMFASILEKLRSSVLENEDYDLEQLAGHRPADAEAGECVVVMEPWSFAIPPIPTSEEASWETFVAATEDLWFEWTTVRSGQVPACAADLRCGVSGSVQMAHGMVVFVTAGHPLYRMAVTHFPADIAIPNRADSLMYFAVPFATMLLEHAWACFQACSLLGDSETR